MGKDEKLRQALSEALRPDETKGEQVSRLFDRMVSKELTIQERVERFKTLLKELREESKQIQRILMEEGQPSGINVLSITEHLDEAIRFSEYVCGVPDHLRK